MSKAHSYSFRSNTREIFVELGSDDFSLIGSGEGEEWPFTNLNLLVPGDAARYPALMEQFERSNAWRLPMWMAEGREAETSQPAGRLLAAIRDLEALFEREGSKLQYSYRLGGDGANSRMMSAKIGDDFWILDSGPGKVEMRMIKPVGGGKMPEVIKTVDLRTTKEVATDWGIITIRKRRIHPRWPEVLVQLREFMEPLPEGEPVSIRMYSPDPTTAELVSMYREGGGADDGAMEAFGAKGTVAREQLFAMLSGRRPMDFRMTVVEILLLAFPGEETNERLRQLAASSKSVPFRDGVASMMSTFGSRQSGTTDKVREQLDRIDTELKRIIEGTD